MKTERRHELQTNTLADALGHVVEGVKPYQQIVLGTILALVVVFGVVRYLTMRSSASEAEGWNAYLSATATDNLEEVADVVEDYPGTAPAMWANLHLGDQHLNRGQDQLFVNKADAKDELKKAEEAYSTVREKASDPMLLQRATLGLARTYESQVELDKAREQYEHLIKTWPDSVFASTAKKRLEDLNDQSTKEFYDWFAEFQPRSAVIDGPGTPGVHPPFNLDDFDSSPLRTPSSFGTPPDTSSGQSETPPKAESESDTPPAP